jgi:exonuclease III
MPKLLFWNLNGKPVENLLARVAKVYSPDILFLAECKIPTNIILDALGSGEIFYKVVPSNCARIRMFTSFDPDFVRPREEGNYFTIVQMTLPARDDIILAAAYLTSKLYQSTASQVHECTRLARKISSVETSIGHRRTIFLGDLNVNPFEEGIVATEGFHAVMSHTVAQRAERRVKGVSYPFFYNPMWSHLGDHSSGPPGTYYYERSEHVEYMWNMFDQILIRPSLLKNFRTEDVRIISNIGEISLLTRQGRPDSSVGSDHLPVMLTLDYCLVRRIRGCFGAQRWG